GRASPAPLQRAEEAFLAHHPQHSLVIDLPAVAVQLGGHPPVAIAGELFHDPFNGRPQRPVRLRQGKDGRVVPVVRAPVDAQHGAGHFQGEGSERIPVQPACLDHLPFLPGVKAPFFSARCSSSISRWARPSAASNAAIRSSAVGSGAGRQTRPPLCSGKAMSPKSSYWCFHFLTSVWQRLCSRQSWASRCSPVATWRATCNLNSRLKVRFIGVLPCLPGRTAKGRILSILSALRQPRLRHVAGLVAPVCVSA